LFGNLVALALTIPFPRFISALPDADPSTAAIQHIFPSSDEDSERSPALDLHALPVDDLTGGHRSTIALGA
jgi:hypothetical protein